MRQNHRYKRKWMEKYSNKLIELNELDFSKNSSIYQ